MSVLCVCCVCVVWVCVVFVLCLCCVCVVCVVCCVCVVLLCVLCVLCDLCGCVVFVLCCCVCCVCCVFCVFVLCLCCVCVCVVCVVLCVLEERERGRGRECNRFCLGERHSKLLHKSLRKPVHQGVQRVQPTYSPWFSRRPSIGTRFRVSRIRNRPRVTVNPSAMTIGVQNHVHLFVLHIPLCCRRIMYIPLYCTSPCAVDCHTTRATATSFPPCVLEARTVQD